MLVEFLAWWTTVRTHCREEKPVADLHLLTHVSGIKDLNFECYFDLLCREFHLEVARGFCWKVLIPPAATRGSGRLNKPFDTGECCRNATKRMGLRLTARDLRWQPSQQRLTRPHCSCYLATWLGREDDYESGQECIQSTRKGPPDQQGRHSRGPRV